MAPLSQCLVLSLAASAAAFSPAGTVSSRPTQAVPKTVAFESFGFDFAEDQAENAPPQLLGEARYKQWVATTNDNSFLNRQVRYESRLFVFFNLHGIYFLSAKLRWRVRCPRGGR